MWEAKPTFQWRAWILILYATATWCSTRIFVDQVWHFLIRVKWKPTKSLKTPHVANPLTNVALLNPFAMTSVPTDLLSFRCSSFSSYRRTLFTKSNAKPFAPAHFVFSSNPPIKFCKQESMGSETFLEVLLAILLPPVGVFLRYGCGVILLTQTLNFLTQNLLFSWTGLFFFFFFFWIFGKMQVEFWIDLLLTILGYIPGIIYAIYVLVG